MGFSLGLFAIFDHTDGQINLFWARFFDTLLPEKVPVWTNLTLLFWVCRLLGIFMSYFCTFDAFWIFLCFLRIILVRPWFSHDLFLFLFWRILHFLALSRIIWTAVQAVAIWGVTQSYFCTFYAFWIFLCFFKNHPGQDFSWLASVPVFEDSELPRLFSELSGLLSKQWRSGE